MPGIWRIFITPLSIHLVGFPPRRRRGRPATRRMLVSLQLHEGACRLCCGTVARTRVATLTWALAQAMAKSAREWRVRWFSWMSPFRNTRLE